MNTLPAGLGFVVVGDSADSVVSIADNDPTAVTLTHTPGRNNFFLIEETVGSSVSFTVTLSRPLNFMPIESLNVPIVMTTRTGATLPPDFLLAFGVSATGNGVSQTEPSGCPPLSFRHGACLKFAGSTTNTVQTATVTLTSEGWADNDMRNDYIDIRIGNIRLWDRRTWRGCGGVPRQSAGQVEASRYP